MVGGVKQKCEGIIPLLALTFWVVDANRVVPK